tara:strand:+ start:1202 stop:1342 length:141 start_codon:yes stop_codon:yes gene_type:complete
MANSERGVAFGYLTGNARRKTVNARPGLSLGDQFEAVDLAKGQGGA